MFASLKEKLDGFVWSPEEEDRRRWKLTEDGVFSVKSTYEKLIDLMLAEEKWNDDEKIVFRGIWKSPAPLKVVVFSWKAFHNRIPNKDNLRIRNVLPGETTTFYVWCGRVEESMVHLFLHCDLAMEVWWKVMRWWNFNLVMPPNLFVHWAGWNRVESRM